MTKENKFAIEVKITASESIEKRLRKIFAYIKEDYKNLKCFMRDLESTGKYGIILSAEIDKTRNLETDILTLERICYEGGQILELNASVFNEEANFVFIIRRASHLDILSNSYKLLDSELLGEYEFLDLDLFNQGIGYSDNK